MDREALGSNLEARFVLDVSRWAHGHKCPECPMPGFQAAPMTIPPEVLKCIKGAVVCILSAVFGSGASPAADPKGAEPKKAK